MWFLNYLKPLGEPVWDNIQVRTVSAWCADSTNAWEPGVRMTSFLSGRRPNVTLNYLKPMNDPISDNILVRGLRSGRVEERNGVTRQPTNPAGHRSGLNRRARDRAQPGRRMAAQENKP
jgi:hypothetical protein